MCALVVGSLLLLLSACSSPFSLTIVTPRPDEVASVFVLYGDDDDFAVQEGTGEVAALVAPDGLKGYHGYAQFEVVGTEGDARWSLLDESLKALQVRWSAPDQTLRLGLPRGKLQALPNLAIAVVVRVGRDYRFRRWRHTTLTSAQSDLALTVTADGVDSNY